MQWYKTVVGTPQQQFETQGTFYIFTTGASGSFFMAMDYEVELTQWNLAANSPFVLVDEEAQLYKKVVTSSAKRPALSSSVMPPDKV